MSESYERERFPTVPPFSLSLTLRSPHKANVPLRRQNNSRLDELSSKVSALRGVTVDIYDNARSQDVLDNTNEVFSSMTTSIKGSAGRLGRMAQSGNKVAILKLAGMITGAVVVLWWVLGWVFRRKGGGGVEGT
ncbi:MAG: hypothetical protein Q9208_003615 [Pyrenodesmia sp. 3 TL-2023]